MARPKSYDPDEAVARARDAFWEHGYETLGIRAIEELTGLGRFAIRTEFGGKEGLFLKTLEAYACDTDTYVLAPLREGGDLEAIVTMLQNLVAPYEGSPRRFGCLMVNTLVENVGGANTTLAERTDAHFEGIGGAVADVLHAEKKRGVLRKAINIGEAAQFVIGVVMGATIMNRRAGRIEAAEGFVAQAVRTVRSWARDAS